MAITLSSKYLDELKKKGSNNPNIIIAAEILFTSFIADGTYLADGSITAVGSESAGAEKWGWSTGGFSDVMPILGTVSSLQNKLNIKGGFSSLGQITVTIQGRDNFLDLIRDQYLKNRRVTRMDGFDVAGFTYADYAPTFTGKILDWTRNGDTLSLTIGDDALVDTKRKIPTENDTKTQVRDYRSMNPVDIMLDILKSEPISIPEALIDTAQFESERDIWLAPLVFDRVLTKPEQALDLLAELQRDTNSFIIHDGEKITFKYFGPPAPGENVEEWTDDNAILQDSLSVKSGYQDKFYNRIIIYYDYDEDGNNKNESYSRANITVDASSQGSTQWDESSTLEVKSRWIRTIAYTQTSTVAGVTIYHASISNDTGDGSLIYNNTNNTLTWTPPGDSVGATVKLNKDGYYQIFGADTTKFVRVVVTTASLPSSNKTDTITISSLNGEALASSLGSKLLQRHRDPVPSINFTVDLNKVSLEGGFLKPTDPINITSNEVSYKGVDSLNRERFMLTSVRPDFANGTVAIEALKAGLPADNSVKYGFIAPAGQPDYPTASITEREYAYIGRASDNKVNAGTVDGYVIYY